jgi:hypothetical protein
VQPVAVGRLDDQRVGVGNRRIGQHRAVRLAEVAGEHQLAASAVCPDPDLGDRRAGMWPASRNRSTIPGASGVSRS